MGGNNIIYGIHGLLWMMWFMFWYYNILCALKWVFYFASDIDTAFGSGVGGGYEVGVEYKVGSENGCSVNNDIKD